MATSIYINDVDQSSQIIWDSLSVEQNLTSQVDTASFIYRKYGTKTLTIAINDSIVIYDGTTKVFAGTVINISETTEETTQGLFFQIDCIDYTYQLDSLLVASSYEDVKIRDIIADLVSEYVNEDVSIEPCQEIGTWYADRDATNLVLNDTNAIRGEKCFEFDVDVSKTSSNFSDLRSSAMSFDISEQVANDGSFLLWFYRPLGLTELTSIRLFVGSTLWTHYLSIEITTDYKGEAIKAGWNLLKFNLADRIELGTPNYSLIIGFILRINYGASQADVEGVMFDDLRLCNTDSPFTTANIDNETEIEKIVFNQIPFSQAIQRLCDIIKYEWYVDYEKDIHFFAKFTEIAPYNITDISGNYIYQSIERTIDGSQIVNQVKVRGGVYDGETFTDYITVVGNDTLSFKLPYKFSNLVVELDTGAGYVAQTVGIDFIDKFVADGGTADVLYNYQQDMIKWKTALADTNSIKFSGNPKVPVLAIASDSESITTYGLREKIIRDNSIEDLNIARKRAKAEVNTYKEPVGDVSFRTYTSGLRVGQTINYTSTQRGINVDYIIRSLKISSDTPERFIYNAELVTTRKYGLIEYLRRLDQIDSTSFDENEVAEIIKVDTKIISIGESITRVLPYRDYEDITIGEVIYKDPIGAGVEPIWVLGWHFPTSASDPKRMGLLDYSMKLY